MVVDVVVEEDDIEVDSVTKSVVVIVVGVTVDTVVD